MYCYALYLLFVFKLKHRTSTGYKAKHFVYVPYFEFNIVRQLFYELFINIYIIKALYCVFNKHVYDCFNPGLKVLRHKTMKNHVRTVKN